MTANHVEAALNFPNIFPRFCGQGFLERDDKELALACLQIYNDWMIDDWCAGSAAGRLIPLTLVPMWDPELAAAEVRRCAGKGSYAITFSESPSKLGCASMYSGEWDVLWAACEETETTVSMHIGSSSSMPTTSPDAPLATSMSMYAQNAEGSLADWVFSGTLARFPDIKIAYAESQVGWMPFMLERLDAVYREGRGGVGGDGVLPSEVVQGRVFGCIFDDLFGLKVRDEVGVEQILFETDYPHSDGTFPHSRKVAHGLFTRSRHERARVLARAARQCHPGLRPGAVRHHRIAARNGRSIRAGETGRSREHERRRLPASTARPPRSSIRTAPTTCRGSRSGASATPTGASRTSGSGGSRSRSNRSTWRSSPDGTRE